MSMDPARLYEIYVAQYKYVLRWRWLIVVGWGAMMYVTGRVFAWAYLHTPRTDWIFLLLAAALSFGFWMAELRNRSAVQRWRRALAEVEAAVIPPGLSRPFADEVGGQTLGDKLRSHSAFVTFVMLGSTILLVIYAVYAASHEGKLP